MSVALFFDDEQCALLREMLDFVPLNKRYITFVVDLLQRVPEPVVAPSCDGSALPVPAVDGAGGVALVAFTDKGKSALADVLRRLPDGEEI